MQAMASIAWPELVAASGETEGLRPKVAVVILAGVLLGLALAVYDSIRYSAYDKIGLELTPEILTQKAREVVSRLGYPGRPADSAYGLFIDDDFQDAVQKNDKPHPNWNEVLTAAPSLLEYWYRQSAKQLADEQVSHGRVGCVGEPELEDLRLDDRYRHVRAEPEEVIRACRAAGEPCRTRPQSARS